MNIDKDFAVQMVLVTRELHNRFRRTDNSEKPMVEDEIMAYYANLRFIRRHAEWLENYLLEQIAKQKQEPNGQISAGAVQRLDPPPDSPATGSLEDSRDS